MPMWHGYWGGPWGGFGWIVPLLALVGMIVMILVCIRRMSGMGHCGCLPSPGQSAPSEVAALRREIQDLREDLHKLRKQA
jgi:uncharacterized membrane protein